MTTENITSIRVTVSVRDRLEKYKLVPNEPNSVLLERLLLYLDTQNKEEIIKLTMGR